MMVKSNDVGVDAVFEAGKHYILRYKEPHSFEEAKIFYSDFNANLVDISNGKEYSSFEVSDQNSLFARIKNYFDPNGRRTNCRNSERHNCASDERRCRDEGGPGQATQILVADGQ